MAKVMTTQEVLNILETGDFEKLIGAMESEVLEFKGAPYQLDTPKLKLELAKDVSALANVAGGIIVMGIKTCIEEGHPHEVAEQIRKFPEAMINIKQYGNIIDEWIYPRPNLEIKWAPSSQDTQKGVAYIMVPESETGRKPFLTINILYEDDKILGNVVGFFERKGDKVIHWSTEERSKIVNGELRRSQVKPYKLLEVWRDGTVIFVADGEGYLCWGNSVGEEFLWINTLTLIETVYLFSLFVKNIFEVVKAPDCNVQMQLHVRNIPKSRKYGLSKAKPKLRWMYNLERDIVWASKPNVRVIKSWVLRSTTPEKAAYELVSELYTKFDVEHEFIPYVKECEGEKVIDIEGIKSIG